MSVRGKVIIALGALFIFFFGTMAFSYYKFVNIYKRSLIDKIKIVGLNLMSDINDVLSLGISLGELEKMEDECLKLVESGVKTMSESMEEGVETGLSYCFITDNKGKILYHSEADKMGEVLKDPVTLKTIKLKQVMENTILQEDHKIMDISIPILDNFTEELLGVIRLGLPFSRISEKTTPILTTNVIVAMVMIGGGLFIWFFFLRYLVRPLSLMVNKSMVVAKGDLTEIIPVASRDEIGQVADAFNKMIKRLHDMFLQVRDSARKVLEASNSISKSSKKVLTGSEKQADSVKQSQSSVGEIKSSIEHIAQKVESLTTSFKNNFASILEMNATIEEIAENAESLSFSVEETTSSISQITTTTKETSNSVEVLKRNSDDVASSIVEMNASIKQIEDNANITANLSEEVTQSAENGKRKVDVTMEGIENINSASKDATKVMGDLKGRMDEIGKVLGVITDITERTNLLALNAAIIAAQAGEGGREFRVIADEIKSLADQTASRTEDIRGLIKGVQGESDRATQAVDYIREIVLEGVNLATESGKALDDILVRSKNAKEKVVEIAKATKEQTASSRQINESVNNTIRMIQEFSKSTQEEVEGLEQIRSAAENMKGRTLQVKEAIQEQNRRTESINESLKEMSAMVEDIRNAIQEQKTGGDRIVHEVGNIFNISKDNRENVSHMEEMMSILMTQAELLEKGIEKFNL